nr:hypothetical protein [Tanacetum cinerariifolium]
MIDYALWEVIENGATLPKTKVMKGVMTEMPIKTAEEKALRRLEVKARKRDDIQAKIDDDHQLAERLQAQEQEELVFKRINIFEDFRTKLVKGKEKRVGEDLVQEITKKQKVEDDKEKAELKQLMETIPDEEEVAIDAIPLAVMPLRIVDWKIHKEGKKSYYQIVRADGKSQMYMIFSQMPKSFDREDLENLYKLTGLDEFVNKPIVENCKAKSSEEEPK